MKLNINDMAKIDKEWVCEIFQDHSADLTRYAASIIGNPEQAKDAVQETFLRLCKEDPDIIKPKLRPWLFRVCRTRAIDLCRKEKSKVSSVDESYLSNQPAEDLSPLAHAERKESQHALMAMIQGLPGSQKEVIRLKFQQMLSYKEIAEITGNSISNVGVLIHTAMKTLRSDICQNL